MILLICSFSGVGECLAIDTITVTIKFVPCSNQLGFICQVKQKPHPDKIEQMKLPYYVHPLDNVTLNGFESLVGFSNKAVKETELPSSAHFMGDISSYMTDVIMPLGFSTTKGFTLGLWINPGTLDGNPYVLSIDNILYIIIENKKPKLTYCPSGAADLSQCSHETVDIELKLNSWQFLAFVFDSNTNRTFITVNETYGTIDNGESSYNVKQVNFYVEYENTSPTIMFGKNINGERLFVGKISCFQYYNKPLTKSQIYQMSQVCHVPKNYRRAKSCPEDSFEIDDTCYKLSDKPMTYTEAQLKCTSPPNSIQITRLAYPNKYQHQQSLLILAKRSKAVETVFLGIDRMSGNIMNPFFKS